MFDFSETSRNILTSSRPSLVSKLDMWQDSVEVRHKNHICQWGSGLGSHDALYKAEYGGHLGERCCSPPHFVAEVIPCFKMWQTNITKLMFWRSWHFAR